MSIYGKLLSNSDNKDDLFESKKSKMNEDEKLKGTYRVKDALKKDIEEALSKIGFTLKSISKTTSKYGEGKDKLEKNDVDFKIKEPLEDIRAIEKIEKVLLPFTKSGKKSDLNIDKYNTSLWIKVKDEYIEDKKVNENIHDIEHIVLFPEELTDEEEYSRMVLLGDIGGISDLTDTMGDIYITSMKEVPEDKTEPYNSKARITITFEGEDVNEENLEKIIEFINSETSFELPEIESDNEISFDFDPKYV